MNSKKFWGFFFFLICVCHAIGQTSINSKLDSIRKIIVKSQYSQLDTMNLYLQKYKNLIESQDSAALADYHSMQGVYYSQMADYETSKKEQMQALLIAQKISNDSLQAKAYQRLGVVSKATGDYDVALDHFFKAREIAYDTKDWETGVTVEIAMSQTYWRMGEFKKSMEQINTALSTAEDKKLGNEILYMIYMEKGNLFFFAGKLDEAMEMFRKTESIIQDSEHLDGIAALYSNMGAIYFFRDDLETAIEYYQKGYELAQKYNDLVNMGIAKMNTGEALYNLDRYDAAQKNLDESLELFKRINSKRNIIDNYGYLYEMETKRSDYQNALEYYKLRTIYRDSVLNEEKLATISNLEVKYETAEKEQKITEQNLELQTQEATIAKQQIVQISLLGGLGFLILGGLLFYNRNKAKEREKLQAAVLEEKERGFEAVVKASEDERKRISKDLHDGIGQEMAALKMALHHITRNETDQEKKERLEKVYNICSKSADEIRDISHQMMPRSLVEKGLVEAIDDLLETSFKYTDIKYNFEHKNTDTRFDERIEICLYRVLQELINNIIKHSNATNVEVLLYQRNNNIIFMVEDNGVGMKKSSKKGHGVLNIKSRIDMIKGSINFEPSTQTGTSAMIVVPVK